MLVGGSGRKRGGQARKISRRKKRLHLELHQTWWLGGWARRSGAWWQAWARHSRSRTVGGAPQARCTWPPSCPPLEAPAPVTPDLCTELTHILSLLVMTCFPLTLPPSEGKRLGRLLSGPLPSWDPAFHMQPWQTPPTLTGFDLVPPMGHRGLICELRVPGHPPLGSRSPTWGTLAGQPPALAGKSMGRSSQGVPSLPAAGEATSLRGHNKGRRMEQRWSRTALHGAGWCIHALSAVPPLSLYRPAHVAPTSTSCPLQSQPMASLGLASHCWLGLSLLPKGLAHFPLMAWLHPEPFL